MKNDKEKSSRHTNMMMDCILFVHYYVHTYLNKKLQQF